MANEVKWIRIATDIFDDEKMYAIETQQDGYLLELVWFKLLCLAGRCNENGFLTINNKLAYTNEMLSKVFRLDIGTVQRAIDLFQSLDMIEVVDNTYMISNWTKHQNNDGLEEIRAKGRERSKKYRDKQKQLKLEQKESNVTNDESNVTDNVTVTSHRNVICSYSISNSNIINLSLILNSYKDKDYINNNIYLREIIEKWFKYKDELKPKSKNHYTESGIITLLDKFVRVSKQYGFTAVAEVVDNSISNNYMGIIWDKIRPSTRPQQSVMDEWINA